MGFINWHHITSRKFLACRFAPAVGTGDDVNVFSFHLYLLNFSPWDIVRLTSSAERGLSLRYSAVLGPQDGLRAAEPPLRATRLFAQALKLKHSSSNLPALIIPCKGPRPLGRTPY